MGQNKYGENDRKTRIVERIAQLSRLLGMIPADGTITIRDPITQDTMTLSEWLDSTRDSFLGLSLVIGKELDIQLP